MNYRDEFNASISDPVAFWQKQAQQLAWYKFPQTILQNDSDDIARWFADGELNTSYLALDIHVEQGRGEQIALIYDSPVTNTIKKITYVELRDAVAQCAGMLQQLGATKGDRILIYLPMIPEAAIAMLACARIGAIHSVVFGGFAAHELAVRIDDATPTIILTASCGIEVDKIIAYKPIVDNAIERAQHKPKHCVVYQRAQLRAELNSPRDLDWQAAIANAPRVDPIPLRATDPLYVLYTSGTTGKPKGIVRDNGGHAVALHYSMRAIYDAKAGDVFWAASDVGWVVGHSYIVYAPLLAGCTSILYEGKPVRTPDAGAFWRVVEQHRVKTLFAAPTAFRAIRKEDPDAVLAKKYDLSSLHNLFLAGERLDPPTYDWLREKFNLPVVDHWWQTETGWAIAANPIGIENFASKAGSATKPTPGFDVRILDDNGNECAANEQGNIVVKLPLPPSCLPTIWNNHARFIAGYLQRFPGFYLCGDGGYFDDDGYLFVMGRIDDVINVAGHRLSTGEIEEVVAAHPAIAECAVIGIEDEMRGQIPIAFAIKKDGSAIDENTLEREVVAMVREQVGALANFKQLIVVKRLPKTRSGKILRAVLRAMIDGKEYTVPSTIDDPLSLDEVLIELKRRALGRSTP